MASTRGSSGSGRTHAGRGGGSGSGGWRSGSGRHFDDYWSLSTRPLHGAVLLALFVAAFEVGSVLYLRIESAGLQHTVRAKRLLDLLFQHFGVAGFMATGIAMLTVLLVWHMLRRDPWVVRPVVLAGMLLEACLWALPILVFGTIFRRAAAAWALADPGAMTDGCALLPAFAGDGTDLMQLSWQARATIAIGAGIYEEMLFRLIGIAVVHLIVKDLLQASELVARTVAIAATAVMFALYHDVSSLPPAEKWAALAFYFAAGSYFGVIYVTRGLGVVVAAHAVYDILALVILAR